MMENQAGPSAGDEASAFLCFCVAATTEWGGVRVVVGAEVEAANVNGNSWTKELHRPDFEGAC